MGLIRRILLFLFPALADDKFQGSSRKSKSIPDLVLQISYIGKMHQFLVIDKDNKCRRFYRNLCHIEDLQSSSSVRRRLLKSDCLRKDLIKNTCLDTKCVLAIVIVRMVYGNSMNGLLPLLTLYAALGCILGHNFPISMEFRGGKGIAASVGMIIAFDWRIFIVCAVVFFALFFTTHYVSLCSLSAYAVAFILVLVFGHMGKYGIDQAHTFIPFPRARG